MLGWGGAGDGKVSSFLLMFSQTWILTFFFSCFHILAKYPINPTALSAQNNIVLLTFYSAVPFVVELFHYHISRLFFKKHIGIF